MPVRTSQRFCDLTVAAQGIAPTGYVVTTYRDVFRRMLQQDALEALDQLDD